VTCTSHENISAALSWNLMVRVWVVSAGLNNCSGPSFSEKLKSAPTVLPVPPLSALITRTCPDAELIVMMLKSTNGT